MWVSWTLHFLSVQVNSRPTACLISFLLQGKLKKKITHQRKISCFSTSPHKTFINSEIYNIIMPLFFWRMQTVRQRFVLRPKAVIKFSERLFPFWTKKEQTGPKKQEKLVHLDSFSLVLSLLIGLLVLFVISWQVDKLC